MTIVPLFPWLIPTRFFKLLGAAFDRAGWNEYTGQRYYQNVIGRWHWWKQKKKRGKGPIWAHICGNSSTQLEILVRLWEIVHTCTDHPSQRRKYPDTLHAQAQLSSCSQLLVVHQQYEESLLPCSHASIGIYRNRYSWQLFLLKKEKLGIKTLVLPRGTYLRFSRLKIESLPV